MAAFADRLRLYRLTREWTQEYLADRLGMTKQNVSLYETGKQVPKLDVAKAIAENIGADFFWLIGDDQIGHVPDRPNNEKYKKLMDIVEQLTDDQIDVLTNLASHLANNRALFSRNSTA